jgi:defect-in-organelle-trafficking protein DotD
MLCASSKRAARIFCHAQQETQEKHSFFSSDGIPCLSVINCSVMNKRIRESLSMNGKMSVICLLFLVLCACAPPKPPRGYNISESEHSLAEAAFSVSRSMVDLAETAQAAHPLPTLTPPPSPASYGMGGLTTIDWSGPVQPLLKQIANAANYRLRVLGTAPAIPVIVTIYSKNVMLGDALRDVGFQCGRRASVVVYPESRVIELRYAKN